MISWASSSPQNARPYPYADYGAPGGGRSNPRNTYGAPAGGWANPGAGGPGLEYGSPVVQINPVVGYPAGYPRAGCGALCVYDYNCNPECPVCYGGRCGSYY